MIRKRERLLNYGLVLCTIAYILFIIFYDHYRIKNYDGVVLEDGKEVAYHIVMLVVFIFFNILVLAAGSAILTVILFLLTGALISETKKKTVVMVVLMICKILSCVLTVAGAYVAYSLAHTDLLMKIVYALMPTLYLASIVHSVVFFKKIAAQQ
ncbi:MAG: hypothetical protein IJ373_05780 [Clostridia bacterium]|nr:hypothetical protein [Clostridia bacterium]MBQ8446886.1 hypothetical protein [Clostridia bacterium]